MSESLTISRWKNNSGFLTKNEIYYSHTDTVKIALVYRGVWRETLHVRLWQNILLSTRELVTIDLNVGVAREGAMGAVTPQLDGEPTHPSCLDAETFVAFGASNLTHSALDWPPQT